MAPGALFPTDSVVENPVENVFEGPEKKLLLEFCSEGEPARPLQNKPGEANTCNTAVRSMNNTFNSRTLRGLGTGHIKEILDAARCTILSVVSNDSTDAYLLSESSLFVSDCQIILKTCGSTTLLHALPVILRLVFETLGMEVTYVQFSRIGYLFPDAQSHPHDCFDHEVTYLNHHLATKGNVFQSTSHTGSRWYLYFARLRQSPEKSASGNPGYVIPVSESNRSAGSKRTLEVYMFDLDPVVMKRFMFHDRAHMIGTDNVGSGTTSEGIITLLGDHDVVDGFNFAPCGYSMNSLRRDAYYTIHVSPERGASYVSFETTAHVGSVPSLVAAVVKLFRPGRFTVSYLVRNCEGILEDAALQVTRDIVSRLLSTEYSVIREPDVLNGTENAGFFASVSSFQHLIPVRKVGDSLGHHDKVHRALQSVAKKHGAHFSDGSIPEEPSFQDFENDENYGPLHVVNLGRVARNCSVLQSIASKQALKIRYTVRSNTDRGVLALLSGLGVEFEAADAYEVDLLARLGVCRSRIILVTPVLTSALISRFPLVGTVALFDIPSETIHAALLSSEVTIELRLVDDNGLMELNTVIDQMTKRSLTVVSIALDSGPDSCLSNLDNFALGRYVIDCCHSTANGRRGIRTDMFSLHFGALWVSQNVSGCNDDSSCLESYMSRLPKDIAISLDASRALLSGSISLRTRVVGRRGRRKIGDAVGKSPDNVAYSYYLSDGAYGALSCVLMSPSEKGNALNPQFKQRRFNVSSQTSGAKCVFGLRPRNADTTIDEGSGKPERCRATLYGPTCDALDCVWRGDLPVLNVGDGVMFSDVGAYASASRTAFNGFGRSFDVSYMLALADV